MEIKNNSVLVADDHSIVRYGIILLLKDALPLAEFYEAATFTETKKILNDRLIELLILDINIPGGDNVRMVESLKAQFPEVKILIFSAYPEQIFALRYIQAGANGYLHKDSSEQVIKKAVETVLNGKSFLSDAVKDDAFSQILSKNNGLNGISGLSNRELDVAKHLIKGLGIIEIAALLNLQMSTVSTYKKRVFEKLRIRNLPELINQFSELK